MKKVKEQLAFHYYSPFFEAPNTADSLCQAKPFEMVKSRELSTTKCYFLECKMNDDGLSNIAKHETNKTICLILYDLS